MIKIAFSWDDGAVEDMKLMDLSLKYEIPGIFFIPAYNEERKILHKEDIKILAKNNFEIGAHSYSHKSLTQIKLKRAEEEIYNGKLYLQDLLGQEVSHFCFPDGHYNSGLIKIAKNFFLSARTADTGALINKQSFLIKPTFHFYDRGKKSLLYNSFKYSFTLLQIILSNIQRDDYFGLIRTIITELSKSDDLNYINIWGHSWEFEELNLWHELEGLFIFINNSYKTDKICYSDLLLRSNKCSQNE